MSYLVAKRFKEIGCIALEVKRGKELADFVHRMNHELDSNIEIVTISRPEAYGEYSPYRFVDTYEEFEAETRKL